MNNTKQIEFMDKLVMIANNVSFTPNIMKEIFEVEHSYDAQHFYNKFINTDCNMVTFYSLLDKDNKKKFVNWIIRINTCDY